MPLTRVAVKICGITRLEDAEAAVSLGADAVGFNFWPKSPRVVESARVRGIVERLRKDVMKVGVFVNQDSELVRRIADEAGLTHIQLHGDETSAFASRLNRPVIKAGAVQFFKHEDWPADTIWLIDANDPVARGGTGRTADWSAAAALARVRQVWLAGGLTPANVRAAIEQVQPFGVDVSSGVEQAPGIKDLAKLQAFFAAVARASLERGTRSARVEAEQ